MKIILSILLLGVLFLVPATSTSADCGLCGDLTGDGEINILDVTAFVQWYYSWPEVITPNCPASADMNCDGAVRVGTHPASDLQILIDYMFNSGPAPCDPVAFPDC
ncbi:MAG: hypothetical protein KAR42_09790 [candidate division Zixibacteria bacterium]|nr:hypothetical protein [candidate division Zixibacteria bacterium]